jgi:SAM-dependent methyltransferase
MIQDYSSLSKVDDILKNRYSFMRNLVEKGLNEFGEEWASEFDDMLTKLFPDGEGLETAVEGYVRFAVDALRLQVSFDKTGEYENKTYEEAAQEVYHNEEYMVGLYLPGILLSHFFWPHHYRQNNFFKSTFLKDMERSGAEYFADIGIGTGFYSRMILTSLPDIRGTGFDISENSQAYTRQHIEKFGVSTRYDVELRDVIANTPEQITDWLVSVEVLEHLEDPLTFLKALRRMLKPGGKAFVTAALNAPNADHIYLYRTPAEALEQLQEAGFVLEQYHSGFAHAPRKPGLAVPEITAFIVT